MSFKTITQLKDIFHRNENDSVTNPDDSKTKDFPTNHISQTLHHMKHNSSQNAPETSDSDVWKSYDENVG